MDRYDDSYSNCAERRFTAQYGGDLVKSCNVSNVCNMLAKNNSDSEYYGRDLVMRCNICNIEVTNVKSSKYFVGLIM